MAHCFQKTCLALLVALACVAADDAQENPQRAALTKEEVLAAVEAQRARIQDLSVTYTMKPVRTDDEHASTLERQTVVTRGARSYIKVEAGPSAADPDGPMRRIEAAYNGQASTVHSPAITRAALYQERRQETQIDGAKPFFAIAMMCPAWEDGFGANDLNLVSLLRSERTRVRETQESIDGHACYVVESVSPDGHVEGVFWLDPARGWLPVRRESLFMAENPSVPLAEATITEAVEAADGVWLPVGGTYKVRHADGPQRGEPLTEWAVEVERLPDGRWDLSVNSGVSEEFFDLWRRLPPGTSLWDTVTDTFVYNDVSRYDWRTRQVEAMTGGGELPADEEAPSTPVASAEPAPRQAAQSEPVRPSPTGRLALVIIGLVGVTLALVAHRRLRARRVKALSVRPDR